MTQSIQPAATAPAVDDSLRTGLRRMQRLLASRRIFASMAGAAGAEVTQQGVDILTALADGAARPIGEVARLARLDGGAVSRQITRLEADGYVRREGARRGSVVLVTATRRGRTLLEKVEAVRSDQLQRALSGWTAEEQAELGRLLVRLADDLQGAAYLPVR
jgi:DNA-binding MarR family transcriptional regulator